MNFRQLLAFMITMFGLLIIAVQNPPRNYNTVTIIGICIGLLMIITGAFMYYKARKDLI